ncbi:hypothetical protein RGQ29_029246 [Quercus rubra]|uniref:Uncharacterized protein n=1 Tax=Quercus rubra TaxID=3512 RepID=A0AAN7EU14_QUERU|nr:hypothetical protein RGQ29_029246 [Quercus rubra]
MSIVKDHVNFTKLEFVALDVAGKNYLSWITDAKIHLDAMALRDTIENGNQASQNDWAKVMIFIHHHLYEELKNKETETERVLTLQSFTER